MMGDQTGLQKVLIYSVVSIQNPKFTNINICGCVLYKKVKKSEIEKFPCFPQNLKIQKKQELEQNDSHLEQ